MISPGSTTTDGTRLVLTQGLKVDNLRQLLYEARAFFEVLTQVISIKSAPALARSARGSCAPPHSRCLRIGSATSMGRLRRSYAAPHCAVHTPAPHGLRPTGHAVAWPRTAKGIQHCVLSKTTGTGSRNNRKSMAGVLSHRRTDDLASPPLIISYVECTGRFIIYPILVRLVATGEEIV